MWDVTSYDFVLLCFIVISTHTSRVGCDFAVVELEIEFLFLLTHPVWDVTATSLIVMPYRSFLLTHPVWDVTFRLVFCCCCHIFLLTHPVWDVTLMYFHPALLIYISTHTSRVGCDTGFSAPILQNQISTHTSRVGCD